MFKRYVAFTLALLSMAATARAQQQVPVVPASADPRVPAPRASDGCTGRLVALTCAGNACQLVLPIVGTPGCKLRIESRGCTEWPGTNHRRHVAESSRQRCGFPSTA